jgi:hypothetical protein
MISLPVNAGNAASRPSASGFQAVVIRLAVLVAVIGSLFAQDANILKPLAWKQFAQEVSKDPEFQKEVRAIMPSLEGEKKALATKCISQMVSGNGVLATGTEVDSLVVKKLKAKARDFVVGEGIEILDSLSDEELLAIASGAAEAGKEAANRIVQIVAAGDAKRAIDAPKQGLVTSSKTGTRFRLIPGLADPAMVTFESTRWKGTYLRHEVWRIEAAERPDDVILQKGFDWQATFKIVKVNEDTVLIEAGNRAGEFITIEPEGRYALATAKDDPLRQQFKLVEK